MDMMDIVTDYQQLNQVQTQGTASAWKAVSNAAKAVQGTETEDKTAAFAEALREELDQLSQRSELSKALAASSLLGATADLSNVSEMLKTESGRGAISAMADNALASIVFGTSDSEQNSVLKSMTQVSTSEQSLEEALKDVLEILESKGAGDQAEKE